MSWYVKRFTANCPRCESGTVTIVVTGDTGRYNGPPEHCYPVEEESSISPCSHCGVEDFDEMEVVAIEADQSPCDEGDHEPDDYVHPSEYGDSAL